MAVSGEDELHMIKMAIWSGFYGPEAVDAMIDDFLVEDEATDLAALRAAASTEFARKAEAEKTWPLTTDCDRLDAAFDALEGQAILALHDAGVTMSDGHSDAAEALSRRPKGRFFGYCFYHGQDVERALESGGLMIAFDHVDAAAERVRVGQIVEAALKAAGLVTVWDGDADRRIAIPAFEWKRRRAE